VSLNRSLIRQGKYSPFTALSNSLVLLFSQGSAKSPPEAESRAQGSSTEVSVVTAPRSEASGIISANSCSGPGSSGPLSLHIPNKDCSAPPTQDRGAHPQTGRVQSRHYGISTWIGQSGFGSAPKVKWPGNTMFNPIDLKSFPT